MSYLFDLEDFNTYCRGKGEAILIQMRDEVGYYEEEYYRINNTYDGYIPKQETLFFNSDGSISIYLIDNFGVKKLFDYGEFCCLDRMPFIIASAKQRYGLFEDIDLNTINFSWDNNKQSCRWKPIAGDCSIETYKIALNPVFDDGALFNVEQNDKSCNLTIDFSYLFKFDCEKLLKTLATPDTDPKLLEDKKAKEAQIANTKTICESLSDNLNSTIKEFNKTNYSLENNGKFYCINEANNGLSQLEIVLGPLKYKKFINGEPNSYDSRDFANFLNLNNQSINQSNKELMFECDTPYGTKTQLDKEIDSLTLQLELCQSNLTKLEAELTKFVESVSVSVECSKPINVLESLDVSVTLDVIESDGSLKTVTEFDLLPSIGFGNLYEYLVEKQDESGFYFCSLPKPTETWTSGCTSLISYELTAPNGLTNTDKNLNVSTCNTIKDSLITSLLNESPFGTSDNDIKAFNKTLNKQSFASNWLNFTKFIDDETIISQIKNKKIKLSLKINNTCTDVCIYIDNINLTKECVNGESKLVTISKSPGFELEKIIDNKKSWVNNTVRVNREFDIENINNLTVFRNTDYDVNDERLVINTKEIDLEINIASAIENDVQCFINDNPDLLNHVPSNDCGCDLLECYEDVFKIIPYAEAVDSGIIPSPLDPEDLATRTRATRDAWLKAANELILATGPYLDIQNGIYHPNPSEDVMTTYRATRDTWIKALHEFNLASGGGHIEGLTNDNAFESSVQSNIYTTNNYSLKEKLAPQMFNTKCGRIFKRNFGGDGYVYLVETKTKELKLFWAFEDYAPRNTTWFDITSVVQEDYAANWDYQGTPEKASQYCRSLGNNYETAYQMSLFHYQTNGNTSHNQWLNPVEDTFFIDWDDVKGKCMTNMFKQLVPEQFSMPYPITSINQWTNYSGPTATIENPQCTLDTYLRYSATTACTAVNFTWPNVAADIDTIYRKYRNDVHKLQNSTKLSEKTATYFLYIIDPITKMVPDETSGYIPVKVTTTIRKGSRDGDIVFKEEYVVNDPTSTCVLADEMYGANGLNKLRIFIGITDPNSAYLNPNLASWDFSGCASYGTLLSGNTSTLPFPGASDNATDRNGRYDENYYVHFDVVNNSTGYVYEVTNNDYNLKDRPLPIVCPSSASTQTFNINAALNRINTHKTTMLKNIQDDLDWALDNCSCDLPEPPMFTDAMYLDFMDDVSRMPSFENLVALPYTSETVDYSSSATLFRDDYTALDYRHNYYDPLRDSIWGLEYNIATGMTMGFPIEAYPKLNYSGLTEPNFDPDKMGNYVKGKVKKLANLWWKKAYTYSAWTATTYVTHSKTLAEIFPNVQDFKYLRAQSLPSDLPIKGNAGDLIVIGYPTSYVGYAWDPILESWSTGLYDFIKTTILNTRTAQRDAKIRTKKQLLLVLKPFLWANEFVPAHGLKQWMYGNAKNFDPSTTTGNDVIYNYNNGLPLGLPPAYTVTATTHIIPAYTGNSDNIIY